MKTITTITGLLMLLATATYGQWSKTNLSEKKFKMGAAILGHEAWFAGGSVISEVVPTDEVEIYDLGKGVWNMNHLSVARQYPAAVSNGSKVFFAGGTVNFITVFSTVDIYDTLTHQWTVENLSVPRFYLSAVSKDNKVLFAGGGDLQQNIFYDVVDIYNTEKGTWTTAKLSVPRTAIASAVIGDLAIFAGGYNQVNFTDRVDIYNFTTNTWSAAALSQARAFAGACTLGNKVYIAGGIVRNRTPSSRVDIYDITTGTWTTDSLSVARGMVGATVTTCNQAFFVGGGNLDINTRSWSNESNVIDIYDATTNSWSTDHASNGLIGHSVVSSGNQLIIAGGKGPTPEGGIEAHSLVEIFTCRTGHCLPRGLLFSSQSDIDQYQPDHPACTQIDGDVTIKSDGITNLYGLSILTAIGGNLNIVGNSSLSDLSGLETLTFIGGSLNILENNRLDSLSELKGLTYLEGDLVIEDNPALKSLIGLENISSNSINRIYILSNSALQNCGVKSICEYLSSPNGTIEIDGNATGCNSGQEVREACTSGLEQIHSPENQFKIYPNPSSTQITIKTTTTPIKNTFLTLYDLNGRQIIKRHLTEPTMVIDVSALKQGIYIMKATNDKIVLVCKLIKQ